MKSKTVTRVLLALIINTVVGVIFASLLGLPVWTGAAVMNLVGFVSPLIPMPAALREGVYVEAWTGQVVEQFTHAQQGTFLDGVPDFSRYANNDVIHLVDVSGDPTVLIDNTTYPLEVEELKDGDVAISLSKFETKPTSITDDELHAISYDKMAIVKQRHGNKLGESQLDKALHAFAPVEQTDTTPVLKTTGEAVDGRNRCTRKDILALKSKLDKLRVPKSGRRLVLCSDHINDLLEEDQKFKDQYHNYENGVIAKMYGFEIFEFVNCPLFGQNFKKKAFGAAATDGDFEASIFFYVPRMFKSKGTTTMYYSEAKTDPLNKRNLVSFTSRFVALPQKRDNATGAIVSAKVTA